MKNKVVTFGEVMLRLSPPGYERFVQTDGLSLRVGGAEANVAVALAQYGFESHFVSKLPQHELGQVVVNQLRRYGVRDDFVVRGGDRVGIYFVETGASQRGSKVIYDRKHSSINTLERGEVDWDGAFENAAWFHFSGITAALGPLPLARLEEACRAAKHRGVKVSCDLNYREKLWSPIEAQRAMVPLMEFVDVCFANEEDAEKCLGLPAAHSDVQRGELNERAYVDLAQRMKNAFEFEAVMITLRESHSASRNGWSALLVDDRQCKDGYRSRRYDIQVVDRVGGGDSCASGLIYGLLTKADSREALEFAVAASCLNQTIPFDFNLVTVDEVERLARGPGSGRVER